MPRTWVEFLFVVAITAFLCCFVLVALPDGGAQ